MSRFYDATLTRATFEQKLVDHIVAKDARLAGRKCYKDLDDRLDDIFIDSELFYLENLFPKAFKDVSKIEFDMENVYKGFDSDLVTRMEGINLLPNGMPYLGIHAGGDWENLLFFIVYWDGSSFRGYVPTKGNQFNRKTKMAYGNEDYEADLEDAKKNNIYVENDQIVCWSYSNYDEDVKEQNCVEMEKDIMNRIVKK